MWSCTGVWTTIFLLLTMKKFTDNYYYTNLSNDEKLIETGLFASKDSVLVFVVKFLLKL